MPDGIAVILKGELKFSTVYLDLLMPLWHHISCLEPQF